ncbi:Acb2/Tad1 domain-containing protein [Luteimonas terricola]|uniref:Acb2/Tad1 hairpin domain-containing protein n=1 Tax=Luteimonas terricola TaxID=645597 RepID=A0ABQ2EGW5_9GAMM|nr:hypothetical protein [Luteimonas terricola]GGK08707.1 hypothetical protein GCM10011394_17620 [Luteimonas terricola]
MENQHRKISGYRELAQWEIDAMNAIKTQAAMVGDLIETLGKLQGVDQRAVAIARTELQTGFMWAVRAIAQPTTF